MPRTNTTAKKSISVDRPNARVQFVFPAPESNYITKIIIPEKSEWRTELHWHELYDEYICVRKGRILVTIGDVTRECGPEDGDVKIPKFTVHEFMRSDIDLKDEEKEAGDVEVWERTDPADGLKEVFFRNLASVITERHETAKGGLLMLQLLTMVAHLDNYAVIMPGAAGYYATHLLYSLSSLVGWLAGYRPWYEEYTPARLHAVAAAGAAKSKLN